MKDYSNEYRSVAPVGDISALQSDERTAKANSPTSSGLPLEFTVPEINKCEFAFVNYNGSDRDFIAVEVLTPTGKDLVTLNALVKSYFTKAPKKLSSGFDTSGCEPIYLFDFINESNSGGAPLEVFEAHFVGKSFIKDSNVKTFEGKDFDKEAKQFASFVPKSRNTYKVIE